MNEYLALQTARKTETKKRRQHNISYKVAVVSKFIKQLSELAQGHLQMALVDETSSRGKSMLDKLSVIETMLYRIIVDHIMANPEGESPGFESVEVVRGYRVIKCDDQFSLHFLMNVIGKNQKSWQGLKLKLLSATKAEGSHLGTKHGVGSQ